MDKLDGMIVCDYCGNKKAKRRSYTTLEGTFCNPDCGMDFVLDKETAELGETEEVIDWLKPGRWIVGIAFALFLVSKCFQSG